ncbi:pyrolysin [Pyrococcus furiosus DSM 3638]|uniref:Pyrolysin n=3 Tax=Pyrococcus furiosus TaxID=2261 RepID=PLS_PYRFU|nr:pyrolysin [Pyrococcus furiosus]P72186.2 RecName: Full=Pyrolysin; Flags: Precursor [Pyrococcus furiosus DSM 3638]AAL80411.1 pyrolysin [Pyrococcus furiosus DSM 3638]AFN03074.1 pyrolysin [Pyrococcus furiosus COM1]QEK78004.1 pyrolysin [Pyrococcus furiosus DSM 3638]
MNKKGLTVLFIAIMLLSVVPVHFVSAGTPPVSSENSTTSILPNQQVVTKEVSQAALNAIMKGQPNMVLIIKTKEGKLEEAKTELEKLGAEILDENRVLNMLLVKIKPEKVKELNYISSLEKAWLNREVKLSPPIVEKDVKTKEPSLEPKMYNSTWVINALQFIQEFGYDGSGVVVAVLDTGVDPNHPFLSITPDGRRKIIEWKDFTDEGFVDTSFSFSKVVNGTLIINTTFQVASGLTLNESTGLMEYVVKTVYVSNVTIGNITSANGIYHFGLLPERYFDLNFDGDQEDFYPVLLVNSTGNGYDIAYVDTDLDYDFTDEVPLGQYNVTYDVAVFSYYYGPLNYVLAEIDPNGEYAVFGWDGHGHGTHVAGTVAGYDSNNDAWDWLSMYSGEWEVFSRLYGWDYTNVTTDTVQGVAPGAQIMAIRVLRSDGRGSMWDIIEGMTYAATHGADVISMSLGGNAPYLDGTDPESVAVDELTEKYGVVFVIAAGNEGPGINIVGSPGVATKAITVGAAAVPINVGVYVSQALGYPDYYGFYYFPAYTNVRIAFFSSRGPRIDGEIKPNVVAPGYGIYSSLPMWIGGADFMSGTSMATPHVSGVVALLISGAKAEGIYYNPDIIKKVLESGATWLEGDPYTGQKYTELDQGHGLVNVTKSWEILKAINGTTLPIVDHWADKSYSDFAEYLGVDVIRGLYARNSIPDIVEWHIKYVGDTEYRTFEIYATEPWIKPFVSGSVILENNTEFVLRVKYDVEGLEPGLYVGRIIIDDPTTPVIEDEILNTIVIPEKFTPENNYTLTWYDINGPEMVTHHFFTVPEGVDVLYAMTTYWDYGLYRPDGMFVFPYQLDYLPAAVSNPMPGNWELVWTGFNFAPLYESGFLVRIYGVEITPSVWYINRTYLDTNTEFSIEFNITNIYAPINATLIPIGLGTYNASVESVGDGEFFIKGIEVPEGTAELKIRIGNPSVPNSDLDLYLYDSKGNLVALDGNPTAEEEVVVEYPKPGVYSIVVHGYSVRDENGNPTTTTFDLVVQMTLDNGNIKLDKDSIILGSNESVVVTANITIDRDHPTGVYSGIIEIRDNEVYQDTNTSIAKIPITLVIDKADFAVGLTPAEGVLGEARNYTLIVKHALTLEPVPNATVIIGNYTYLTDENGTVTFTYAPTKLGSDEITVIVKKENFNTLEKTFQITVSEPEITEEDINEPKLAMSSPEANATIVSVEMESEGGVKKTVTVEITINGTANETATIVVPVPKKAENIEVSGDHVISYSIEEGEYAKYVIITVKFASPVTVTVTYTIYAGPRVSILTLNFLGYSWYRLYSQKFDELYQKALELGVDNETLALALSYHEKAKEYYEKALELSEGNIIQYLGDIRLLPPLRQAYINEMKAVKILEKAIEELEGEE